MILFNIKEWEFTGGNENFDSNNTENQLAYIYQDMTTAIVGKFFKGKLVSGSSRKIIGYRLVIVMKLREVRNTFE